MLGLIGGYAVGMLLPQKYVATTEVLVVPTVAGSDTRVSGSAQSSEVVIETEAQIVRSAQVASLASKALDGRISERALLAGSDVSVPSNSQVIKISFEADSPELAQAGARALAEAYLERRQSDAAAEIADTVKQLEEQLTTATAELKKTTDELARLSSSDVARRTLLESYRSTYVATISSLNVRLSELRLRTPTGGQIITAAALPAKPKGLTPTVLAAAGLVVGLLVGSAVIVFWRQITSRRDVEDLGKTPPVLGVVADVPMTAAVGSADAEVRLGDVRRKIDAFGGQQGPLVLFGLGNTRLCGRTAVSLVEGWARGADGTRSADGSGRVALVLADADGSVLPVGDRPGLADLVSGRADVSHAAQRVEGLSSIVVGPGVKHPADERPTRQEIAAAVAQLNQAFSTVTVSTGSPLETLPADLALTAGKIVIVIDAAVWRSKSVEAALREIDWLGLSDRVAGVVVVSAAAPGENRLPSKTGGVTTDAQPQLVDVVDDSGRHG